MEKREIYEQLETAAHRAYARGIQTGNGGNLSARTDEGMIVKASGGSLADCSRDGSGFVETTLEGRAWEKEKLAGKPTREVFLHGLLYRICPDAGGIMHCHSPWSIVWSYSTRALPALTLHMQLKAGCDIPVAEIPGAAVCPEDEWVIRKLFARNPKLPAFILAGHGVVAVGKNVLEAEHMAELVEETAQIAVLRGLCEIAGVF